MSRVVDQQGQGQGQGQGTAAPAQPQPDGKGGWIMDEGGQKGAWIMDDGADEGAAGAGAHPPQQPASPQPQPQRQQPQQPAGQPGQYQFATSTGHIFRGTSQEDVMQQMDAALVRTARTAVQREQELRQARTYMGRQGGSGAQIRGGFAHQADDGQSQSGGADAGRQSTFSAQKFYQALAAEKPMEAIEMAIQEYFGVDDPREALAVSYTVSRKMSDRLETADFMSNNHDFPASPASAEILIGRLNSDRVPLTRWNMEVAFAQLVNEGVLQRIQIHQSDQRQGQGQGYRDEYQQTGAPMSPTPAPAPSRGTGAPPIPGGIRSGVGTENIGERELSDFEFEQLSTPEQKDYLQKRGLI